MRDRRNGHCRRLARDGGRKRTNTLHRQPARSRRCQLVPCAGFGPYVAAYLASQNWTQQNIGFILSAAGLVGLPANCSTPSVPSGPLSPGALMIAAAALTIALWPAFPVVLAAVGHAALSEQLGRKFRFDRRAARRLSYRPRQLFFVVSSHILYHCGIGPAAACRPRLQPVFGHSLWQRLRRPASPGAERAALG